MIIYFGIFSSPSTVQLGLPIVFLNIWRQTKKLPTKLLKTNTNEMLIVGFLNALPLFFYRRLRGVLLLLLLAT